ncbi:Ribonuclease H domain [Sesbania bispinosa]|nr:Ribonuclease H domain [Sesbania bispinosa]
MRASPLGPTLGLQSLRPVISSEMDSPSKIIDVWSEEEWTLEQLWTALPCNLIDQIRALRPLFNATVADTVLRIGFWRTSNKILSPSSPLFGKFGRPPRLVKSRAPLDDQIAINTDGSVNQHGTGFGGILRNANGSWIKGFYGHLHNSDILCAELHAVWKGLELCWRLNFRNVLCLSDFLLAVELIRKGVDRFHHYAAIICEVRALLDRGWNVEVVHTLREGNQAADFLAKKGTLELSSFILLHDPPVELRDTLLADSLGTSFVRA